MRILLLTQLLPYPPDSGPKVKTWQLLRHMAREHQVTLVSFVREDPPAAIARLRQLCAEVHVVPIRRGPGADLVALGRSLASRQPWLMVRDRRSEMSRLVAELTRRRRYDLAYADQLNMAQYALAAAAEKTQLDCHNALWLLYRRLTPLLPAHRRWLMRREWRLLRHYEGAMARRFDVVTAVSEVDAAALREAMGADGPQVHLVPIAVDAEAVEPLDPARDARHLLHLGTMYWPPNADAVLWFARRVLPRIRRRVPAPFDVVGARPPRAVRRLARQLPEVEVTGYVADPSPYLERAAALVVPLRAGAGMRVKILEAMARGLPVVSTPLGCEGIAARPGVELLSGSDEGELAEAAVEILQRPRRRQELAEAGRRLVLERYDIRSVYPRLAALWR